MQESRLTDLAATQTAHAALQPTDQPVVQPLAVLVCALGGEGGGVLSEWLYDAAVLAGYPAQATSVPGVAQRTGATTYYIEVFPRLAAELQGRRPIFSLNPVPGGLDLLVSSELLETLRQVGHGMSSPQRTQVISSVARALTVAEKMQMSDGRVDSAALAGTLQAHCRAAELLDLGDLARRTGTAISAVLLGAIAASGALPMPRGAYEEAIRHSGKGVEASLRGFALAFETLTQQRLQRQAVEAALQPAQAPNAATTWAKPAAQPDAGPASAAATDLRVLGRQRVADYQDEAYARLYDERLQRIASAEGSERLSDAVGSVGPAGQKGSTARAPGPAQIESARWLALWMAFDDIVQVARLKLAVSRLARVRREVKATDDQVLKVYDHFKPGSAEFAALLPEAWAKRLTAWDRQRVAAGREPWALPLKVGAHSLRGTLALRLAAACKRLRRHGSRFALEQQLIERWVGAVERGLQEHHPLGLELARCGRLVKGYGSTNERGKENLLHIVDHLAFVPGLNGAARAQAVKAAREAALADDAGTALDTTLRAHGVATRPVREHTVRWYKRRPSAS